MFLSQYGAKMPAMKEHGKNQLWHRIRGAVDGYAVELVRLIGESYSSDTVQQAWAEFTSGSAQPFACDDPHTELFFSWLFHRWSPSREKGNRTFGPAEGPVCPPSRERVRVPVLACAPCRGMLVFSSP